MPNILFIFFRRMRLPLLVLIVIHAIAVLGLVLIPGVDAQGQSVEMDFFHAVYFVSYMSTTIGFGELPYEFTAAQRLWVMFMIYLTVVSWLYSIGTLIGLVQDKAFQQAITQRRFARRVRHIAEPFYLVCGYGETGQSLVRALISRNKYPVVIDRSLDRVRQLRLDNLRTFVPALVGDAGLPEYLLLAGLGHPQCAGVVALSGSNEVNLSISIAAKLLNPDVPVVCEADSHDIEDNMSSFGTDHIIDPFDNFANYLATAIQSPCLFLLQEWLTGVSHQLLSDPIYPPKGKWIVCGYGRFGKVIVDRLRHEEIEVVIVEATPEDVNAPKGTVRGWGTDAKTLEEAGIMNAHAIVAGTDNDANNLSIVMTARDLNPDLFVVLRQNRKQNQPVFDAVHANMTMHASRIVATRIRVLLGTPLLYEFVSLAFFNDDEWACELVSRITALVNIEVPEVWEVEVQDEDAHAVNQAVYSGNAVKLKHLMRNPRIRGRELPCIALFLLRKQDRLLLPDGETMIKVGDRLLFCGHHSARFDMEWVLQNEHALEYILTGHSARQSIVWRWMSGLFNQGKN